MKRFALLILALTPFAASAATTFEISAGQGYAQAQKDGVWYQQRFPHSLGMESAALAAGMRTDLSPRIAMHTGAYWFGQNSSHAMAVTHDDLYSKRSATGCPGECPALATFKGHGYTWGLQALVEFHTTGATQYGFMVGPILHHTSWTETVADWFPTMPTGDGGFVAGDVHPVHLKESRWVLSGAVGVRASCGRGFVELVHYLDGKSASSSRYFPPIWKSHTAARIGITF
ncbi:hypothetical protein XccvBFoX3_gp55 [Xanthomonas phage FoX3]|uniref:Uncharacterized protein n=1 Tax=Xanthomonas phage FoX3 TaxID=2723899 RepID=A0A858NPW6_9CAUD|nr:hypothetical protein KNU95_gp55 [Xanthomonas phage FoX3]QJB21955.1 hypothetical protein XccvBFoX3_gp55 [Xanthomonas phage FoX3]